MLRVNRKLVGFLIAAGVVAGAGDGWRVIGPGGGGAMFQPAISPHTSQDVLVACDMTGTYISHNEGSDWWMFNLHGVVRFFAFDPKDANTMYAVTSGIYKSTDRGATWRLIRPAANTPVTMNDDHADEVFVNGGGRPAALAIDPADSNAIYAVFQEKADTWFEMSRDGGRTWTRGEPLSAGGRRIFVDAASPAKERTLFVLGRNTVTVRRGGAWTTGPAPQGVDQFVDMSAGFAPNGQLVVYGHTATAIYVSPDGGQTWRESKMDSSARFVTIATAEHQPTVAYVSFRLADKYFGVAKTTDHGATWQPVLRESSQETAPNLRDNWITARFGPDWGEHPLGLGVAPNDPDICFSTDLGRTLRTTDGGKTWQAVYSRQAAGGGWTSTGLDVTTTYGVHFDPFDKRRIFISYTDINLFRSEDGGASWQSASQGIPQRWLNTLYWMEFDPEVKGRAWAVASGTHDLPRPKMWRRTPVSRYQGGVVISNDGGRSWQPSGSGMPPTAATHILLDPRSPADARVLYVAGFGRGVFKSVDGGQSWSLKNNGIEGKEPFAWRLARDRDGTLYLVVARRSEDGSIGNAGDGALYRSTDGAEHWTKLSLPAEVNGPNGLAIDPKDPTRLYLAAWRRNREGEGGGGIYLSTDGGGSWRRVLDRDQHVYDVTIDPRNASVLYACGFESSIWRSADRGETWQRVAGYDFKWGHRVVPDPLSPDHIYVTTFGGSVWYGPAHSAIK